MTIPSHIATAIKADVSMTLPDKLDALRGAATRVRDLDAEIKDVEQRLSDLKRDRSELLTKTLPDLMDLAGVPGIDLEAAGNMPAINLKMVPYYSANIAASWPPERRDAAFKWLDDSGNGDLIKTTIVVEFDREDRAGAIAAALKIKTFGLEPQVRETVSAQTLSAWLRECYEEGGDLPPLDVIGGSVGRTVKIKEVKS